MRWWKESLPFVAMVLVQLGYTGMNIFSKAAMDSGMTPFVLITYRQIFATPAIAPFAYFLERYLCCTTLNVFLYFIGLQHTTPTIVCTADNMFHAITYIVGIIVGPKKLKIKERAGLAKLFGTCLCVGGAMIFSFYHRSVLHVPQSGIH